MGRNTKQNQRHARRDEIAARNNAEAERLRLCEIDDDDEYEAAMAEWTRKWNPMADEPSTTIKGPSQEHS